MARGHTDTAPAPARLAGRLIARTLQADARIVDLGARGEVAAKQRVAQEWQAEAWEYVDEIGELWFAMNYLANAMARIDLFPARQASLADEPTPLEEGDPMFEDATAALRELQMPEDGASPILADLTVMLDVPGEGYLVGRNAGRDAETGELLSEERQSWAMYSADQITAGGSGKWILVEAPGEKGVELGATDYVARIWRPHRRWRKLATSPMRALRMPCEELLLLTKMIRAQTSSRLNAGLLLVPSELTFGKPNPTEAEGGDGESDDFVEDLIAAMVTPISQPDSASAVVPNVIRGGKDALEAVRWIELSRQLDPQAQALRNELLGRIANGVDLPREIMLGMSSTPFSRTSWQIDAQTWKAHLEPKVQTGAGGLTSAYLRPYLVGQGHDRKDVAEIVTGYSPDNLVGQPNEGENATSAYDRFAISTERYLRALGFNPDADRPSADEIAERLKIAATIRELRQVQQGSTPKASDADHLALAAGLVGWFEARDAHDVTRAPEALTPLVVSTGPKAVTASGSPRPVGERLAEIDARLRARLLAEANGLMLRALERAGARVRRKLGNTELARSLREVAQWGVCGAIGAEGVTRLGFDDGDLLDGAFDPLADTWDTLVTRAQGEAQRLAIAAGADFGDTAVDGHTATEDRNAGWELLLAALLALARQRLYDPSPTSPLGEHDATLAVPPGVVRAALQRAGGALGAIARGGAMLVAAKLGRERPAGGVATGERVLSALGAGGVDVASWAWMHFDGGNDFPPHADLDGVEFTSWDDPVLAITPEGDWLGNAYYYPGDHGGCNCDAVPNLAASESGDGPSGATGGESPAADA